MNDLSELLLQNQSSADRASLLQLATSSDSTELVADLMSKDIPTQLRAFMLTTAKSELVRVIRLTDALNKLEDTYIERALADKNGMDMKSLANTMNVIMQSLNRSMELIDRVTNDNNLKLIIDQSTKIYNNGNNSQTNVALLADQGSREKLRNLTTKLLTAISNNPNEIVNASKSPIISAEPVIDASEEVGESNE